MRLNRKKVKTARSFNRIFLTLFRRYTEIIRHPFSARRVIDIYETKRGVLCTAFLSTPNFLPPKK